MTGSEELPQPGPLGGAETFADADAALLCPRDEGVRWIHRGDSNGEDCQLPRAGLLAWRGVS